MAQKMQISDFSVDKYKKFLHLGFKKVLYDFKKILAKKSIGSVLFGRDGHISANIIFLVLALES